jgi:hypothetical protein
LDQLAADFRYARNLVTADECEQWLAGIGVSADEFSEHIVRRSFVAPTGLFDGGASDVERGAVVMDKDQARSFRVDLLLSDKFPPMSSALAWRIALRCENTPAPEAAKVAAQRTLGLENLRLAGLAREDRLAQPGEAAKLIDELPFLEALFQTQTQALLTPEHQHRVLTNLRLPLLRFDLEILELESEAAAREAFLCIKEDGITLDELAAQNHHPLRKRTSFLEEFPQDWQQGLLSATPGAALPPIQVDEGFQLCRLVSKRDPALTDPAVLRRVNDSLLQAHFRELESRHVRWHVNLEIEAS